MRIRNLSLMMLVVTGILSGCDYRERKVIQTERNDATYRLAMADYQAGKLDKAIEGFSKVVSDSPMNASARFQLACLLHDHAHRYLDAIANYRIYREIAPKSDKSRTAGERSELCEQAYRQQVENKVRETVNADMLKELNALKDQIAALQKEKTELTASLEKRDRQCLDMEQENERLRRLAKHIGEGETTEHAVMPDRKTVRELLAEEEDDDDRIRFSRDVKNLRAEEASEKPESTATPLPVTPKPEKKVEKKEPAPTHPPIYEVQEGDTLYDISRRFYGVKDEWKRIRDANKATITPDGRLKAGTKIYLP